MEEFKRLKRIYNREPEEYWDMTSQDYRILATISSMEAELSWIIRTSTELSSKNRDRSDRWYINHLSSYFWLYFEDLKTLKKLWSGALTFFDEY